MDKKIIIEALKRMTVENGCTPEEAVVAKLKLVELEHELENEPTFVIEPQAETEKLPQTLADWAKYNRNDEKVDAFQRQQRKMQENFAKHQRLKDKFQP